MLRYIVEFWEKEENTSRTEKGIININGSIGASVDRIFEFYGRDEILNLKIWECEGILTDDELVDMIKED